MKLPAQQILQKQNQEILNKISGIEGRINNFGTTQAISRFRFRGNGGLVEFAEKNIRFFCFKKKYMADKNEFG